MGDLEQSHSKQMVIDEETERSQELTLRSPSWYLFPQQNSSYTQHMKTKIAEIRRIHKQSVQSKFGPTQFPPPSLMKMLHDPSSYLSSYEKMKDNQLKEHEACERIGKTKREWKGFEQFIKSEKQEVIQHQEQMDYSYQSEFQLIRDRVKEKYERRYGGAAGTYQLSGRGHSIQFGQQLLDFEKKIEDRRSVGNTTRQSLNSKLEIPACLSQVADVSNQQNNALNSSKFFYKRQKTPIQAYSQYKRGMDFRIKSQNSIQMDETGESNAISIHNSSQAPPTAGINKRRIRDNHSGHDY